MEKQSFDDFIRELRQKNDLVSVASKYVNVEHRGRYYWCRCPFHGEKTPSLCINDIDNMFYCFGCHVGGTVINFVMQIESLTFMEAVKLLAEWANMEIPASFAGNGGENIDFENKTIQVKNGITQVPQFDNKGNVVSRVTVIGDTKTACSVREVPVPDILIDALKDWKKEQWVRMQLTGVDLLAPKAIVFSNEDGSVRTYSGTRRIFDRFAKRNGFYGKIHFHTLRHTYSNMLFEMNENPKIIQALLGHKSVKTTLTVYNSVDKSYYRQATEKLNNLFNDEKMAEFKELEKKQDIPAHNIKIDEDEEETDPEILMLEKILAEKKAKRKQQQEEEM